MIDLLRIKLLLKSFQLIFVNKPRPYILFAILILLGHNIWSIIRRDLCRLNFTILWLSFIICTYALAVGVPAWPLNIIGSIDVYNRAHGVFMFCYVLRPISEPIGIKIINLRSFFPSILQFHGELLQLFGRVFHFMKFLFVHISLIHEIQAGIMAKLTLFMTTLLFYITDLMSCILNWFPPENICSFSSLNWITAFQKRIFLV